MWRLFIRLVSGISFVTGIVGWITLPDDAPLWPERFGPVLLSMSRDDLLIALFGLSAAGFALTFLGPFVAGWLKRSRDIVIRAWAALGTALAEKTQSSDQGSVDIYLNRAILYLVDRSEWGAWFSSQPGAPQGQMLYITAGHLLTQAAAAGKIEIHGRLHGDPTFKPINRKYWSLAALRVDPDDATIVQVRTMARVRLEAELAANLPMYLGLHTDRARLLQLYPPKAKDKPVGLLSRWRARLIGIR